MIELVYKNSGKLWAGNFSRNLLLDFLNGISHIKYWYWYSNTLWPWILSRPTLRSSVTQCTLFRSKTLLHRLYYVSVPLMKDSYSVMREEWGVEFCFQHPGWYALWFWIVGGRITWVVLNLLYYLDLCSISQVRFCTMLLCNIPWGPLWYNP